jgi:hypothetical protein
MMMRRLTSYVATAAGAAMASMVLASPAMAGFPVPGPVVGAGLPALAVIAGGYYLIRRRRKG